LATSDDLTKSTNKHGQIRPALRAYWIAFVIEPGEIKDVVTGFVGKYDITRLIPGSKRSRDLNGNPPLTIYGVDTSMTTRCGKPDLWDIIRDG